jgi:hypothetical protein
VFTADVRLTAPLWEWITEPLSKLPKTLEDEGKAALSATICSDETHAKGHSSMALVNRSK